LPGRGEHAVARLGGRTARHRDWFPRSADVLDLAGRTVAERLTDRWGDLWTYDGTAVTGPDNLKVLVRTHSGQPFGHIDLGFVLPPETGGASQVIWDCAIGFGHCLENALLHAIDAWSVTTGAVLLEFLTQHGRFAQHMPYDDELGLPGWHVIHGPPYAWGVGRGPGMLQEWWRENSVLPELGPALTGELDWTTVNGIRISFGVQDGCRTAEVAVNHTRRELASRWLTELDWPASHGPAFVRAFALVSRPQ
jgi:hypothetical protein